ncbi:hypothetical protein OSB04_001873 [Centaurea solstitialis]|uniref:Uncharacterized protein n=1 Tax=Centaurea solstitialis TaxID=347529 RepID=A0AA38WLT8_9ASTR|nr:hypothetical protein OSB04_001873 [Centaurea solstitialis]
MGSLRYKPIMLINGPISLRERITYYTISKVAIIIHYHDSFFCSLILSRHRSPPHPGPCEQAGFKICTKTSFPTKLGFNFKHPTRHDLHQDNPSVVIQRNVPFVLSRDPNPRKWLSVIDHLEPDNIGSFKRPIKLSFLIRIHPKTGLEASPPLLKDKEKRKEKRSHFVSFLSPLGLPFSRPSFRPSPPPPCTTATITARRHRHTTTSVERHHHTATSAERRHHTTTSAERHHHPTTIYISSTTTANNAPINQSETLPCPPVSRKQDPSGDGEAGFNGTGIIERKQLKLKGYTTETQNLTRVSKILVLARPDLSQHLCQFSVR